MAYAATFDIDAPGPREDKGQVGLQIVLAIILYWIVNGVIGFVYLALPIIAAIQVSQKGAAQFLADAQTGPVRWIRYIMGLYSYETLLTDKMPFDNPDEVNFHVQPTGTPTVGSALLRIITSIPHWFVLGILGWIFFFVWLIAAFSLITSGTYPAFASDYARGYLRWTARVLAYMTSLVDEYPPFSFSDNGGAPVTPPPPAQPPAGGPPQS